jgi:hypothetical protein
LNIALKLFNNHAPILFKLVLLVQGNTQNPVVNPLLGDTVCVNSADTQDFESGDPIVGTETFSAPNIPTDEP